MQQRHSGPARAVKGEKKGKEKRKEKKKKRRDCAFRREFNEKPSITAGCPMSKEILDVKIEQHQRGTLMRNGSINRSLDLGRATGNWKVQHQKAAQISRLGSIKTEAKACAAGQSCQSEEMHSHHHSELIYILQVGACCCNTCACIATAKEREFHTAAKQQPVDFLMYA